MVNRLRFGILGTGNIANQFAEGLRGSERCELVAVGSRTAASAKAFSDKHGGARPHGTYDGLLTDPEVDAVYVSLPNTLHREWSVRALRVGKHVLCEKPLAPTVADAEAMFAAADDADRLLVEGFMYRTHPVIREVVERVRGGAIGEVRLVRASFCYATKTVDTNIRFRPELCGGALMDIGCYCVDLGRLLTGEHPDAMHVEAHVHASGVDDYAAGTLRYPGGAMLSFVCGQVTQMNNALMIGGEQGFVEVPVPWKPPVKSARYVLKGQTPPKQDQQTAGAAAKAPPPDERVVDAGRPLFGIEADAFATAVAGEAAPFMSREDSLSNARVLEALRKQAGLTY